MNMKKLVLAAAIAGTAASGAANATIIGVPSEGLLVPFALQGCNYDTGTYPYMAHTGVLIETPALVGADTITNDYTAPNTTKGGYTPPEAKGEWGGGMTVHYYMFDDKSEHVYDSTFVMSPDDVYFWTAPSNLFDFCQNGGTGYKDWVGYVVFADEAARRGGPATFVMTGQAGIAALLDAPYDEIIDVPVVPLADGDDAGGIRIGNEITYSPQQLPRIQDVVPLAAGTRYFGAPGTTTTIVTGLIPLVIGPIEFPFYGLHIISHVMWFSENGMHADIDFCDDEELCVSCSDWTFNELNVIRYYNTDGLLDDQVYDGVKAFKSAMSHKYSDEGEYWVPTADGNTCGVASAPLYGYAGYDGVGMALYEFASKAGVAGVNFQFGSMYFSEFGDSQATAPMLTNGQF